MSIGFLFIGGRVVDTGTLEPKSITDDAFGPGIVDCDVDADIDNGTSFLMGALGSRGSTVWIGVADSSDNAELAGIVGIVSVVGIADTVFPIGVPIDAGPAFSSRCGDSLLAISVGRKVVCTGAIGIAAPDASCAAPACTMIVSALLPRNAATNPTTPAEVASSTAPARAAFMRVERNEDAGWRVTLKSATVFAVSSCFVRAGDDDPTVVSAITAAFGSPYGSENDRDAIGPRTGGGKPAASHRASPTSFAD